MEDIRDAQGETAGFYQLYTPKDHDLTESLVRRAEATGFAGIVVTLDTWINGCRPRDLDNAYIPRFAEDAHHALDNGVDGIICSNHGGRQANGGIAAIDCLPSVVETVCDAPVLLDSGVRGGEDVIKALTLGARAVGIGRPYVWGLSIGDEAMVTHVIKSILAEADLTMAVDGYRTIADLSPAALRLTP